MRPSDAAVMPLPSEEVTPPVTNTNFGTGAALRGFSNCTRLVESEWKRMHHDKARPVRSTAGWIFGHLDRILEPAIVDPAVEPERAEPRVDQHAALDALVVDDRDELRPEPHHPGAQRERSEERRPVGAKDARCDIHPFR